MMTYCDEHGLIEFREYSTAAIIRACNNKLKSIGEAKSKSRRKFVEDWVERGERKWEKSRFKWLFKPATRRGALMAYYGVNKDSYTFVYPYIKVRLKYSGVQNDVKRLLRAASSVEGSVISISSTMAKRCGLI